MFRSSGSHRFRRAVSLLIAAGFLGLAATPALADHDHDGWRDRDDWHDHGHHRGWHHGRGDPHRGPVVVEERPVIVQQRPVYVAPPPPVYYAPPPPPVYYQRPSGIDLFLHLAE